MINTFFFTPQENHIGAYLLIYFFIGLFLKNLKLQERLPKNNSVLHLDKEKTFVVRLLCKKNNVDIWKERK